MKTDNELIAEFMEYFRDPKHIGYHDIWMTHSQKDKVPGCGFWSLNDMAYHTSWDWLMPVVEKIENGMKWKYVVSTFNNLYEDKEGVDYHTVIHDEGNALYLDMPHEDSRIKSVYKAVVEFIKWYNSQKAIIK